MLTVYSTRPNLVLGFHGCDKSIAEQVVTGVTSLKPSENDYDWLGHGIYFWENNPERAFKFAQYRAEHPLKGKDPIDDPCILCAVIGLGRCLDLLESGSLDLVKGAYCTLSESVEDADWKFCCWLPELMFSEKKRKQLFTRKDPSGKIHTRTISTDFYGDCLQPFCR